MSDYVFGANILENLTTGMYQDSRVIYREYIQNACDQIDAAIRGNIIDKQEAHIFINIDKEKRFISIEDNATGIKSEDFQRVLGNIADSDKKLGKNKGFRGIGRLCGLAYCKTVVFTSKAKGENIVSKMSCDAEKMRSLIRDNELGKKSSAEEVLNQIYTFSTELVKADKINTHGFKVELIDINEENFDLLDHIGVKNYLSFVAPVPYQNLFIYRNKIKKHAEELNVKIDEYNIYINGEQIFKNYKTRHQTSKGEDEIFDVEFKDFYDESQNLIAWSWIGLSCFKAVIDRDCPMRGIRLRKDNIQIGNGDTLQKFFKEERGIHYFIGEIFCVSRDLIPNSQRDYFNENPARVKFERQIEIFFKDYMSKIYREGSEINSAFRKINEAAKKSSDFEDKKQSGYFVNNEQIEKAEAELKKTQLEAQKAEQLIQRKKTLDKNNCNNSVIIKIIERSGNIGKSNENENKENNENNSIKRAEQENSNIRTRIEYRADRLSQYSKSERKLISKIYGIIKNSIDEKTSEFIISKIEEALS